ncbi:MAG: DM13 domain-containing protein [Candidatus Dormibacteraeota bacterium]|nr:DM13 domain-containing protein [Candidatus Dormibacteraeota bacterium]
MQLPNPGARHATQTLGWLLLLPLIAAAFFGGNAFGLRDRAFPAPTTLSDQSLSQAAGQAINHTNELPAQPYFVTIATPSGSGNGTRTVSVASDALQWKVDWQCDSGSISIEARQSVAKSQPIAHNAACGGSGENYAVNSGTFTLAITAAGDWRLQVQQQLDRPQNSPPEAAMTAAGSSVLAGGSFYGIDQQGQGTARIYHLADGSYALRLENFYVTPNTDFIIRLSVLQHPGSTPQFIANQYADVAPLPITAGSFNFPIPAGVNPSAYHSVVIWCDRLTSAYAGASLTAA